MYVHTLVVQVYGLAGHAHVGTCTCISAIDLVHGFVNMHAAQPSVWHFSALVQHATLKSWEWPGDEAKCMMY